MCVTYVTHEGCGHTEEVWKQCKRQKDRSRTAHRKKTGFLKSIFTAVPILGCDLPPGKRQIIDQKCAECRDWDKALTAQDRKDRERRMKYRQAALFRAEAEEFHERRRKETKWNWTCQRCAEERRTAERFIREANGGACCARGVDEFEEWERREGYLPKSPETSRHLHRTHQPPSPLREAEHSEAAKREAGAAAISHRWVGHQSSSVTPDIAREIMAIAGTGARDLTDPPSPLQPEPFYQELGLDLKRWGQSIRTAHGSYPPPPPPPDGPLPVRPLAKRSIGMQAPVTRRQVEAPRNFSVPRRPGAALSSASSSSPATSVVRSERHRRMGSSRGLDIQQPQLDVNGVSPLSSPVRSRSRSPSPVSPMSSPNLRSVQSTVSSLNHQLDNAIDYFQPGPVPVAPRRILGFVST